MQLSPNFTLAEFTRSALAQARGINNQAPALVVENLVKTAHVFENIRSMLGNKPIIITSGYRCPQLNAAVGSRTSSDHITGQAADFVAPAFGTPTEIARLLAPLVDTLAIGQLILEGINGKTWVHVSTDKPTRAINRVLTITDTDAGVTPGIVGLA